MKTVGITMRIDEHNHKLVHLVPTDLIKILKDKVKIILIPFLENDTFDNILNYINMCDGIILPGGDDIYPLEIDLCRYLYDNNIPTLGICLGMQTMAVAINGTVSTLSSLDHKSYEKYVHKVKIYNNTKLHNILKAKEILVNSRHKDYIKTTDLVISAISDDNIIEAVEGKNKKFFIGTQWHPENLDDENTQKLFSYFINML